MNFECSSWEPGAPLIKERISTSNPVKGSYMPSQGHKVTSSLSTQLTFEAKSLNLTFSLDEIPSAITMEFGPSRAEPRNLQWNWKYPHDCQLGNSLSPTTSFSDIN